MPNNIGIGLIIIGASIYIYIYVYFVTFFTSDHNFKQVENLKLLFHSRLEEGNTILANN